MAWRIEFVPAAAREMRKLDRQAARRIVTVLEERVARAEDPRVLGAPLAGEHAGYWRWRVGDYRVIGRVEDGLLLIIVVRVAHRREVYRAGGGAR